MKLKNYQIIRSLRKKYPAKTKVELIEMTGRKDMPPGLCGTVKNVDDAGQIHVEWENGGTAVLIPGYDRFQIRKGRCG